MGLDVYGYMVVGVPVEHDNLFITEEKFIHKCDECEADLLKGRRFCSNCGQEFKRVKVTSPTPGLRKLLEEEGFDDLPSNLSFRDLEDIVFNVNSHQTYEDEHFPMAVGVQAVSTGSNRSHRNGVCSVSWLRLEEAKAKAIRMATTLGVENPQVDIYQTIFYSY